MPNEQPVVGFTALIPDFFSKVVLYKLLFISVVWSYRSPFSKASICVNNCLCVFSPGKHEEKQDEGGIVTKNFTKKIQ